MIKRIQGYIGVLLCVTVCSLCLETYVSATTISKHNLLDGYKFTITAKKTGIMTIKNTVKNEILWVGGGRIKAFEGLPYYGWCFGEIQNKDETIKCKNPDDSFDWYLEQGYERYAKRTKNYKFFVKKGEKIKVDFHGDGYSFNLSYSVKAHSVKKPKLNSIKKQNKKVYISWSKVKKAKGYDVQISENKKFKSDTYQHTCKKTKLSGKLEKNKKYYVRVRAFKKISGINVYSNWSNKRNIKMK